MKIPEDAYDQLLIYVEKGAKGNLPPDLIEYVNLLELVRSMHYKFESRTAIVNFLQQPPYNLSYYLANNLYAEALNFFYLDRHITKEAWRNIYAEKLERAADLLLATATTANDLDIYKNMLLSIGKFRGLDQPDEKKPPKGMYDRPYKVYTLNPADIGRKPADKRKLGSFIDSLDVPEQEKERMKGDAMLEDVELFKESEGIEDAKTTNKLKK